MKNQRAVYQGETMTVHRPSMKVSLHRGALVEIVHPAFDVHNTSCTVVSYGEVVWVVRSEQLAPVRVYVSISNLIEAADGALDTTLYVETPDGPAPVSLAHPYVTGEGKRVLLLEAEGEGEHDF